MFLLLGTTGDKRLCFQRGFFFLQDHESSDQLAEQANKQTRIDLFRRVIAYNETGGTDNTEYCFLRLIIQEHAPKAVDYRKDLEKDVSAIRSNFKTLPQVVQQAILDYSKKSKALKGLVP